LLVRKPEGKKQLGRPRCRWDNNIKIGPEEIGCEGLDWINLTQKYSVLNVIKDSVLWS
jgi:hypothetical protein